jgi:hypothetical protein
VQRPGTAIGPLYISSTCCQRAVSCNAEYGSVWISWATGFYQIYNNPQAPLYPNSTLYAPETPDRKSVDSVVRGRAAVLRLLFCEGHIHQNRQAALWDRYPKACTNSVVMLLAMLQVQWGVVSGGPYEKSAQGYTRSYIQVPVQTAHNTFQFL